MYATFNVIVTVEVGNIFSLMDIPAAPRCRDHRVRGCVSPEEISCLLESIDKETGNGKRDFAAISLAAVSGLRAGDIASLKLDDIDWKRKRSRSYREKPIDPLFFLSPC